MIRVYALAFLALLSGCGDQTDSRLTSAGAACANIMGAGIMFKVIMNTAHDLLLNTVFLIMAMAVLAGSLSALLSEFGVISLLNKVFAIFMKPLYGLPGASIAGAITTYLSDNPAIISFSKDKSFTKY